MEDYQFIPACFLCRVSHISVDCQVGNPFVDLSADQVSPICFLCGGPHMSVDCQVGNPFAPSSMKHGNYMSNLPR